MNWGSIAMIMQKSKRISLLMLLCSAVILGLSACSDSDGDETIPIVETRSGYISGIMDSGTFAYLGIPFAAPPVGEKRWRLPVREESWNGVRAADKFGEPCPQDLSPDNIYGLTSCDEDCLYLNVWAPKDTKGGSLPVMFWLHGGGYNAGSASQALCNGANLAKRGVILVSANYRLGPLGFMVGQNLYDTQGQAGNYALFDAVAALEWVRDNIARFGGDPDNVTIFGESAGGSIVTLLQTAPQAEGLFHKAIAMSGTASSNKYVLNLTSSWEEAAQNGLQFQHFLNATSIEEMRRLPYETIIEAATKSKIPFGPVMDGIILSTDPSDTPSESQYAPMVIGTVKDEGTLFIWEYGIETLADYQQALQIWFGNNASLVEAYYPATTDEEAMWQAVSVLGLAGMQEPIRHATRGDSLSVPVYRYYYTHVPPTEAGAYLGCFHGSELAYLFGNLDAAEGYGPSDTVFSNQIMALWSNFAKTGTPYATGLPVWSNFSIGQENAFHLNGPDDFELTEGLSFDEECDLFELIAPEVDPDYPK